MIIQCAHNAFSLEKLGLSPNPNGESLNFSYTLIL